MNFGTNILFAIFCTIQGWKKFGKKIYIHVPCDYVEFSVYRVLILGV